MGFVKHIIMGLLVMSAGIAQAQQWDFGDLPDPTFPTVQSSSSSGYGVGPFHWNIMHEWIGTTTGTSTTSVESSPKTIDMDEDDGFIYIDNMYKNGEFLDLGMVSVPVSTDSDTSVRYLNVVADLNGNGEFASYWDGDRLQYEWVMCNRPIVYQNEVKIITSFFTLVTPVVGVGARRATLTVQKLDTALYGDMGWDGSGPGTGFQRGETEDHLTVYTAQDIEWHPDEEGATYYVPPSDEPLSSFTFQNPPLPGRVVVDGPGRGNPGHGGIPGGPAKGDDPPDGDHPKVLQFPIPDMPLGIPVVTYPPGHDFNAPVAEGGSVEGMPDIKQGKNECVPTATANSVRYMMDKQGLSQGAIDEGYASDSDDLNKRLQEKLKGAMKTSSDTGTTISIKGTNDNFRKGKKSVDLPNSMKTATGESRISTTAASNPSFDQIKEAIDKGYDVEIFVAYYDDEGNKLDMGHMVTVTGYAKLEGGALQLFYHDPADKRDGESAGDTVKPPREHSVIVQNAGFMADKGGMVMHGGLSRPGATAVIKGAFFERLTEPVETDARIMASVPHPVLTGEMIELFAEHAFPDDRSGEETLSGFFFQWYRDDTQLTETYDQVLMLDNLTTHDAGAYSCWIYNFNGMWEMTDPVMVEVLEPLPPSGSKQWTLFD